MSGLLGDTPEAIKAPAVPEPPPVPVVQDEAEEFALREEKKKSGFQSTFLTGNLTPKSTGKKSLLG
jgi:hypothetical protein